MKQRLLRLQRITHVRSLQVKIAENQLFEAKQHLQSIESVRERLAAIEKEDWAREEQNINGAFLRSVDHLKSAVARAQAQLIQPLANANQVVEFRNNELRGAEKMERSAERLTDNHRRLVSDEVERRQDANRINRKPKGKLNVLN